MTILVGETKLIGKTGVYDLPAEQYHADPCKVPSLSRSIAHLLLTSTARRAWKSHPRLNPNYRPTQAKHFDIGAAAHSLMLRDGGDIKIVRSPNYKGFAAQRARDMARGAGLIPILQGDFDEADRMVNAGRVQLTNHENAWAAFSDGGKPEQTLIWSERVDGVLVYCRAMLDWLPKSTGGWLDDFKTSAVTSEPEAWAARCLYPEGLDLQAAMYCRGYKAVFGVPPAGFRFIVQSIEDPYELSTVVMERGDLDLAMRRVEKALEIWAWCMKHKKWGGHPARDCYVMRPAWREKSWIEREDREQLATNDGTDLRALMNDWQAPLDRPKRSKA